LGRALPFGFSTFAFSLSSSFSFYCGRVLGLGFGRTLAFGLSGPFSFSFGLGRALPFGFCTFALSLRSALPLDSGGSFAFGLGRSLSQGLGGRLTLSLAGPLPFGLGSAIGLKGAVGFDYAVSLRAAARL
jgi:hypothetical protein